jgi:hypothetical protein
LPESQAQISERASGLLLARLVEDLAELLHLAPVIDLMAVKLGLDPIELARLRAFAHEGPFVMGLERG